MTRYQPFSNDFYHSNHHGLVGLTTVGLVTGLFSSNGYKNLQGPVLLCDPTSFHLPLPNSTSVILISWLFLDHKPRKQFAWVQALHLLFCLISLSFLLNNVLSEDFPDYLLKITTLIAFLVPSLHCFSHSAYPYQMHVVYILLSYWFVCLLAHPIVL